MNRLRTILAVLLIMLPFTGSAKDLFIRIVPQPESVELTGGTFKAIGASVNCDDAFDEA